MPGNRLTELMPRSLLTITWLLFIADLLDPLHVLAGVRERLSDLLHRQCAAAAVRLLVLCESA
jgi:hypothetical protein